MLEDPIQTTESTTDLYGTRQRFSKRHQHGTVDQIEVNLPKRVLAGNLALDVSQRLRRKNLRVVSEITSGASVPGTNT